MAHTGVMTRVQEGILHLHNMEYLGTLHIFKRLHVNNAVHSLTLETKATTTGLANVFPLLKCINRCRHAAKTTGSTASIIPVCPSEQISGLPRAAQHRLRCAHDVRLMHHLLCYLSLSLFRHFCCSIGALKKRERDARALNPVCCVSYGEERKKERKKENVRSVQPIEQGLFWIQVAFCKEKTPHPSSFTSSLPYARRWRI